VFTASNYSDVLTHFADKHLITIATGATCAYLGDERNLREFLVADETARWLRRAGHTVVFFLIDDSLDPLNFRQLRVAVNKNEELIEKFQHWCGKPIAHLPDPWGCHESYAAHFEEELIDRLHRLDCHPTLVTTAQLYERGVYKPYVTLVLERHEEIMAFFAERFPTYKPDKLFWPICPHCRYIHETRVEAIANSIVEIYCSQCNKRSLVPIEEAEGKLNWKLDCAVRWTLFNIDAEPFNKKYLEPQTGTFPIAQAVCTEFFNGPDVVPLLYGTTDMNRDLSYKLFDSLPASVLRSMMTERPATDITLSREKIMTAVSRFGVLPGMSYLDFIKQLLPMWLLAPEKLTHSQRDLVANGIAFSQHFMDSDICLQMPRRSHFEGQPIPVIREVRNLLREVIRLRDEENPEWEDFQLQIKQIIETMGTHKGQALHRLRVLVGQEQGMPAGRFLFVLPLDYLRVLEYMCDLFVQAKVEMPTEVSASALGSSMTFSH
jgi:lysyl-tRNA synthetase class I